jgi:hypothetical protein
LKNKTIGLIRLDSGFCSNEIFDYLQQKNIDYIVAARFYQPVQQIISQQQAWMIIENGIEISEVNYKAANWKQSRRMVIVRQRIKDRPNAIGKTLTLFDDEASINNIAIPLTLQASNYRPSKYGGCVEIGPMQKTVSKN